MQSTPAFKNLPVLYGSSKTFDRFVQGHETAFQFQTFNTLTTNRTDEALVSTYQKVSWVYKCISLNARTCASIPLRLFATRSTGESPARRLSRRLKRDEVHAIKSLPRFQKNPRIQSAADIEEIFVHPVLDLFCNVNAWENAYEHNELTFVMLDLTGKCFWLLENNALNIPDQMHLLRSQWTKIIKSKQEFIKGFLYGRRAQDRIAIEAEAVIYFKNPSPFDPWEGFSPIAAASEAASRYISMDQQERGRLRNNSRPDFIVKYNGRLADEERRRELERQWNVKRQGPENTGRAYIADEVVGIETLGFSARDMEFLEGRRFTKEELCNIFDVPLALTETKSVNRANMEASIRMHQMFAILPRLTRNEEKMNEKLIPRYNEPRIFLAYDDPVQEDKVFKLKQDESDVKNAIRPINEIRNDRGLEPVPWGDEPLVNISVVPLGISTSTATESADNGGSGHREEDQRRLERAILTGLLKQGDEELTGAANTRLSVSEAETVMGVHTIWGKQSEFIVAGKNLKEVLRRAKDLEEAIDLGTVAEVFISGSRPNMVRGGNSGLRVLGDMDAITDDEQSILIGAWVKDPRVEEILQERSIKLARKMNQDTQKQLSASLAEGMAEGETIPQIRDRVKAVFGDKITKAEAERIARTETHRASHEGMIEAWGQSGVVQGKEWKALNDSCPFCLDLNGTIIPLQASFFDEGSDHKVEFNGREIRQSHNYLPVGGPPTHPNCRCTLIPVIEDL